MILARKLPCKRQQHTWCAKLVYIARKEQPLGLTKLASPCCSKLCMFGIRVLRWRVNFGTFSWMRDVRKKWFRSFGRQAGNEAGVVLNWQQKSTMYHQHSMVQHLRDCMQYVWFWSHYVCVIFSQIGSIVNSCLGKPALPRSFPVIQEMLFQYSPTGQSSSRMLF